MNRDIIKNTVQYINSQNEYIEKIVREAKEKCEIQGKTLLKNIMYIIGLNETDESEFEIPYNLLSKFSNYEVDNISFSYGKDVSDNISVSVGDVSFDVGTLKDYSVHDYDDGDTTEYIFMEKTGDDPDDGYVNDSLYIFIKLPLSLFEISIDECKKVISTYIDGIIKYGKSIDVDVESLDNDINTCFDEEVLNKLLLKRRYVSICNKYNLNNIQITIESTLS